MTKTYSKIMVDLETLDTGNDAGILSIGAVNIETAEEFYEKVEIKSLEPLGFTFSQATLDWWKEQSQEARDEAFSGLLDIRVVLISFAEWLVNQKLKQNSDELLIFGNGAVFDCVVLRNAFDRCDIKVPYTYKNEMCYRTITTMFPKYFEFAKTSTENKLAHSAISDARYQKDILIYILTILKAKEIVLWEN